MATKPNKKLEWVPSDDPLAVSEPPLTKKNNGLTYKERPAFQFLNWLFNLTAKWVNYFDVELNQFSPHELTPPLMGVIVDAGRMWDGSKYVNFPISASPAIGAPTTDPRIDRIAIDYNTNSIVVLKGTEATTPVPPAYAENHYPICRVSLVVNQTEIVDADIDNERPSSPDYVRRTGGKVTGTLQVDKITCLPAKTTGTGAAYVADIGVNYLESGRVYEVQIHINNTGACTVGFGPGTEIVKMLDTSHPYAGALRAGMIAKFLYDSASLVLLNPVLANKNDLALSNWTLAEPPNTSGTDLLAIAHNGSDIFVVVGALDGVGGVMQISTTCGHFWKNITTPQALGLLDITYGNGLFVAVGWPDVTDAYIITSPDGITWTERANPSSLDLLGITYGNGLFVAVGKNDTIDAYIVTSTDGITWTKRANPKAVNLSGITYGNGLFVAVGWPDVTDAYIITSPDGITWTERANPKSEYLYGVTYGNGLFVAVGTAIDTIDAYIITSPDGITWTERANPHPSTLFDIIYENEIFVAVGNEASGNAAYILTSIDGIEWRKRFNPLKFHNLHGVAYGQGTFVAVGDYVNSFVGVLRTLTIE